VRSRRAKKESKIKWSVQTRTPMNDDLRTLYEFRLRLPDLRLRGTVLLYQRQGVAAPVRNKVSGSLAVRFAVVELRRVRHVRGLRVPRTLAGIRAAQLLFLLGLTRVRIGNDLNKLYNQRRGDIWKKKATKLFFFEKRSVERERKEQQRWRFCPGLDFDAATGGRPVSSAAGTASGASVSVVVGRGGGSGVTVVRRFARSVHAKINALFASTELAR